jgi:hypothetical protein
LIIKCIRHLFIHTLSESVGYNDILSLNTYLCNDFTFNDFRFCDRQNIGISRNINNVFTHYLYQQSPPFWWLQNLNSLSQKLLYMQVFSEFISLLPLFLNIKKVNPDVGWAPPWCVLPLVLRLQDKSRYGMLAKIFRTYNIYACNYM